MTCHITILWESLITSTALMRLLSCVSLLMFVNIIYLPYCFVTVAALIWFISSVWHHMANKFPIVFPFGLVQYVTMPKSIWSFLLCIVKTLLLEMKVLSQLLHWYGTSPLCVLRWLVILLFSGKALSHQLHWWGFSPVWVC